MSDGSTERPPGLVVGTAGHIDHGKTSLVRALTGVDTDRLAEEKRRGISIDLGFAHLTLTNGQSISFVDVPGHERFIKNMLAGAAGIRAVLLIIAANESVKPQTREHFDICRLLGIRDGIVVLTKAELATAEQIRAACVDVRNLCSHSFLERSPIVAVSANTGQGLPELKSELSSLAQRIPSRNGTGLARLPIDRSFALRGFGTVVTGTLANGSLRVGDAVRLHPSDKPARIRALEVHDEPVELAVSGQRTAVNLSGLEISDICRGHVLTHVNALATTKLIDARVEWLKNSDISQRRVRMLLHIGTAEVLASVKILQANHPLELLVRMWLSEPVLALPGDRFVLRQPSPAHTIAGGFVIDPFPPARLNRAKTIARLQTLAEADSEKRLQFLAEESAAGLRLEDLVRLSGVAEADVQGIIARSSALAFAEAAQRVLTKTWIAQKRGQLVNWLKTFHRANPSLAGAPIAQARLGLDPDLADAVFDRFPEVHVTGDIVALADHKPEFSNRDVRALASIEDAFRQAGFQPPSPQEVLAAAGADAQQARALLEKLIKSKVLVRISQDLIFHSDTIAHIRASLAAHKGRRFSVPEFKAWTQISRKYAIPLLEYLDRERVTRREGDVRVVL